ncbi:MAG: DUF4397 domain-containing protein [Janthinobacterium lividum]
MFCRVAMPTSPSSRLRLAGMVGLCLASLGLTGCQNITADSPEAAQIRLVDTSTDAPGLDVYLNGSGTAYNLGFATVTSYIPVTPGEYRISANRANTTQALVTARGSLGGTRQYTAVVSNTLNSLQETIYPDANAAAPAGMIAVRVLHAASGVGPIDVYLVPIAGTLANTAPLVRGLGYTGGGVYVNLPANTAYTVSAVPAGVHPALAGPSVALSDVSVSGASGSVRTVVISDAQGNSKGLYGFVLKDFDTP